MQIKKHTRVGDGSTGSPAPKPAKADASQQLRATTNAKEARVKEAGLGGNRTGKASASGKRVQGRRDSKTATIPSTSTPPQTSATQHPEKSPMQIQVNTDHNVPGSDSLNLYVQSNVEAGLGRFGEKITRVVIHLSDDNGDRTRGNDKRCLLEARPAGRQPVVVTHVGATVDDAVDGAVEKMEKLLDSTFAKLHHAKGGTSLHEDATG